ncbi:MAG TPA: monovalent cation/H+ antiporter complex subunit F [Ignavibacteriaceae bacterium]
MKIIKWIIGLVIFAAFFYFNFFVYDGDLMLKFINVILFSTLLVLILVIVGPTAADRIVSVDILGVLIIGLTALLSLYYDESFFIDVGLIWALLSLIATLAFSKILEGRQLDD